MLGRTKTQHNPIPELGIPQGVTNGELVQFNFYGHDHFFGKRPVCIANSLPALKVMWASGLKGPDLTNAPFELTDALF